MNEKIFDYKLFFLGGNSQTGKLKHSCRNTESDFCEWQLPAIPDAATFF